MRRRSASVSTCRLRCGRGGRTTQLGGSRARMRYRTASGVVVVNQGEKRITMRIHDEDIDAMTFQVAELAERQGDRSRAPQCS